MNRIVLKKTNLPTYLHSHVHLHCFKKYFDIYLLIFYILCKPQSIHTSTLASKWSTWTHYLHKSLHLLSINLWQVSTSLTLLQFDISFSFFSCSLSLSLLFFNMSLLFPFLVIHLLLSHFLSLPDFFPLHGLLPVLATGLKGRSKQNKKT